MQGDGEVNRNPRTSRKQLLNWSFKDGGRTYPPSSPGKLEPRFSAESKKSQLLRSNPGALEGQGGALAPLSYVCAGRGPSGARLPLLIVPASPKAALTEHLLCARPSADPSTASLYTGGNGVESCTLGTQYLRAGDLTLQSLAVNSALLGMELNLLEIREHTNVGQCL